MATRTTYYVESLAPGTTNATTTYQDQDSCSITILDADASSSTWAIFFASQFTSSSTASHVKVRLRHDTGTADLAIRKHRMPVANVSWIPFSGATSLTFGASPGNQTISLEFAADVSGTTQMRDAVIFAVKLTGNDSSNVPGTSPTSASTAPVDAATFTAPANGTYDIFGFCEITSTSSPPRWQLLLEDGTTGIRATTLGLGGGSATTIQNGVAHVQRTLTTGQTVKVQFNRPTGSGTMTAAHAAIVGLDTAGFDSTGIASDTTSRATTSAAYVQRNAASTLTWTPTYAVSHLLWGSSCLDMSGQTASLKGGLRTMFDGTEYQETAVSAQGTGSENFMSLGFRRETMSGASATLSWEYGYLDATPTVTSAFAEMGYWQLTAGTPVATQVTGVRFGQQRLTGRR